VSHVCLFNAKACHSVRRAIKIIFWILVLIERVLIRDEHPHGGCMYNRYTVAISDDHPHIINSLKVLFARSDRFSITSETVCGKSLLNVLASTPTDIAITDFSLSSDRSAIDGFAKLRALHSRFPAMNCSAHVAE